MPPRRQSGQRQTARRVVRRVGEYRALVDDAITDLDGEGYERAIRIAELPDIVRGYEEIKLRNVARFRERAAALEAEARQRARTLPRSAGAAEV